MAGNVSPDKVKELLSSFLVKPSNLHEEAKMAGSTDESGDHVHDSSAHLTGSSTNVLRSFEKFVERLDTFSALTWFGKPAELSPIMCARYGWENVDADMLQCVGCKSFLSGQLPSKTNFDSYEESLSKLKRNLLASHDKFCVLAVNPCPEHFCHVPVDDPVTLLSEFIVRAKSLSKARDKLPKIDETDLKELGYDMGQGGAYCKRNVLPDLDVSPWAVALAFTGWTCSDSNKDVLTCTMCRRQVGLWNFASHSPLHTDQETSSEVEIEIDGENGEPRAKRQKVSPDVKEALNPVQEHHHWCPWIQQVPVPSSTPATATTPTSASLPQPGKKPASAPAFILALRAVCPGLMDNNKGLANTMKTSPVVESLRYFRRVIKTWSSPKVHLPASTPSSS